MPLTGIITRINDSAVIVDTLKQILSDRSGKAEFHLPGDHSRHQSASGNFGARPRTEDGIVGTVTVLEDITPFKQLDEMKSDFVNMVAHELRSPLVAIRQQNSVLLEGLAGPLQERQQDLLRKGMKKIDQLLESDQ